MPALSMTSTSLARMRISWVCACVFVCVCVCISVSSDACRPLCALGFVLLCDVCLRFKTDTCIGHTCVCACVCVRFVCLGSTNGGACMCECVNVGVWVCEGYRRIGV